MIWKLYYHVYDNTPNGSTHEIDLTSMEDCVATLQSAEQLLNILGYVIWYAYVISPDGVKHYLRQSWNGDA